ncbi:MAG: type II secretion system protein F [Halothiobacillus sp. 14-56-357]|jgi:type IV pilus assembly protein PilC|uniref:type II secretion system F family protein n=1 Tax=Halothiobacillus sp. 15-55-196 TaxID=1970382 RepID=UPI000BDDE817|nr:type II secretion system F family protein [Halothiobacillus sp. 15-55-196]OZB37077.1 MAG: type II secretion system protein F [Halothiobacillus sp. 15-55-196]OZB56125.1 MAG: type II secretion system protein F [Halothiobacillus sp. 14-56-357]OZB78013.1 MAG: type II secretion system protein F [Halothiobacillus sp. 13-55-115]
MAIAATAKKKPKDEKIIFVYDAKNKDGKIVKGEMTAYNEMVVRAEVRRLGLTVIKVRKKPKPLFSNTASINAKDIAVFARQLATMMTAGLPIVQALDIMAQSAEKVAMKELISTVKNDVESGLTLADAMDKHRKYFDELFVNLVRAGEDSGSLELVLDRIAVYKEKSESLKGKIKKALFYPIAVVVVAFIVTSILLIFVIPQFQELFQGFGATLPAFTLFVIGISNAFKTNWYWIFGGIGFAIFLFVYVKRRSDRFNHFLDQIILKIPIFGPLTEKAAIARFARTLGTMFSAGVPLVEAMEPTAGSTGNAIFKDAVMNMRDIIAAGSPLKVAMQQSKLFPVMVVQMVAIGEETGALDTMLGKVADMYEEEVDNMVDAMSSLLEPMIMAFLGVVVGGLVIAMYLPIFKLGSVV